MTSIQSAFISISAVGITNPSQMSGNQQSQNTTNDLFGSAFSITIGDSSSDTSPLTYSNSANNSQGTSSFEALMASLTGSSSTSGTDTSDTANIASPDSSNAANEISQLFSFLQQMITNTENALENIDSTSATTQASATATDTSNATDPLSQNIFGQSASGDSTSFAENALADGGPLPAFLKQVDSEMGLNSTQQAALQNIATQYQNADNTPQTVQSIAGALAHAGISETI